MNRRMLKGYFFSAGGAAAFGLQGIFVRHMASYGMGSWMIPLFRTSIMALAFFMLSIIQKKYFRISLKHLLQIIFLAINGTILATALFYMAFEHMSVGLATTVNFTYPIFVLSLNAVLYKEKISRSSWIAMGICLAGIVLLCNPEGGFSWTGFALSTGSSIGCAVYFMYLDKSEIMEEMPYCTFNFYFFFTASIMFSVIAALTGQLSFRIPPYGYGWAAMYVIDSGVFAVVFLQLGIRIIGSVKTSLLGALEPLTSVIAGALFLNERMTLMSVAGCILVIGGTMLVVWNPRRNAAEA